MSRPARLRAPAALTCALILAGAACGGADDASGPAATPPAASQPGTAPAATVPAESQPPASGPSGPSETGPPGEPAGTGAGAEPAPAAGLPGPVAAKREAILAAARSRDYEALAKLLDPATFSYSFGESGDPVGYWRRLEEKGEVPILGDVLPVLLGLPFVRQDGVYVWPSAHAKAPAEWTAEDLAGLRQLYSEDEIEAFRRFGAYAGYRAGIREDGTWLFFVAGD